MGAAEAGLVSPHIGERCEEITFKAAEEVLGLGLTGVYFVMGNLRNRKDDEQFDSLLAGTLAGLPSFPSNEDFKSDPVLAGFRDLHTAVGRSNRENVASPENLLRLIRRTGTLPRINLLVDIYNLVSLRTRLALGAHDLAAVDGDIRLTSTTGAERFVPLGATEPKPVPAGEYGYIDGAGEIICRMETRQVEKTKVVLDTTECFYIVQGNRATDASYVWDAANELIALTKEFCGGDERILFGP
ncbi:MULTISPECIES: phenylalanine--tRNA ligase beta subunit-related protein [unclassified Frankia]|uniref:phenylalanine--tRNA ligase beta subunit-related protein n=1 Tax=unclassified Frankia TaxID=2632575 RepID=UPI002024D9E7